MPVRSDLGSRGRTPKYKFGRYGPHSNEAFEAAVIALSRDGDTSDALTENSNASKARRTVHNSRMSKICTLCVVMRALKIDLRCSLLYTVEPRFCGNFFSFKVPTF